VRSAGWDEGAGYSKKEERHASTTVDRAELEAKVQEMYRRVAANPEGEYHFEVGRPLAERLGYPTELLDRVPDEAIASFAGVGYFFDMAALERGESVIDLGSGSGMDVFCAAQHVGSEGRVVGVDFSDDQRAKAQRLASAGGYDQVELRSGRIEELPAEDGAFDCAISNGVINLSPERRACSRRWRAWSVRGAASRSRTLSPSSS
jgi:arsenite methyltransferase